MTYTFSRLISAMAIVCLAVLLIDCHKDQDAQPAPTITGFTPATGFPGDPITITGTGFVSGTTVAFGDVMANIQLLSETQLVATVPAGASTGRITVMANGQVAIASTDFVVEAPLAVTSISPTSGTVSTMITIEGTGFSTTLENNIVDIGGVATKLISATATKLIVSVGQGTVSAVVHVTVGGTKVSAPIPFNILKPTITSFTPASASQGATVTITGTNFSTVASDNAVKFGTLDAVVTASTSTSITTTIPANFTGGKFTVTVDNNAVMSPSDLTVPAPTLTSMSPLHGPPGTEVTLTGTGFGTLPLGAQLILKATDQPDLPLTVSSITDTQINFVIPHTDNAFTGKVDVTIGVQSTITTNDSFEVLADIPRNGLVAFYPFTGNANDKSSNNINGVLHNHNDSHGGPDLANDRFGKSSQSYSFDGVADYIQVANATPLAINGNMTIGMWFYEPGDYSFNKTLINKHTDIGTDGCNGYDLELAHTSTAHTYQISASTKESTSYPTGNFTQSGQWQFVVFVISGTTVNTYSTAYSTNPTHISPVVYSNADPLIDCAADLLIGGQANWDNSNKLGTFSGMIDDVTIYNRALTEDEVQKLYIQTVTKY